MKTKAAQVHKMFSAIAERYDFLNSVLSFSRDKYWRRFTVAALELKGSETVLDVATGTGKLAEEIAARSGTVVGLDFCRTMLLRAKGVTSNTELVLATSEQCPFRDNSFDGATIAFALRNVSDIERTIRETTRVVKEGGRVVCLEFSRPRNRVLRRGHRLYLTTALPVIGRLFAGNREAYLYLGRSILEFCEPHELKEIMERAGLGGVTFHPLTLGVVTVHVGLKRPQIKAATHTG